MNFHASSGRRVNSWKDPTIIMDPTSNPLTVEIGGKPVTLHFDFTTYKKFEEITKKFFMNWFGELQNANSSRKFATQKN